MKTMTKKRATSTAITNTNIHAKELKCIYDIARITRKPNITLRNTINEIMALLPAGFRHPDAAWARVRLNGETYTHGDCHQSNHGMSSEIVVNDETVGTVEVGYAAGTTTGPSAFSPEERILLDAVAERIGAIVASQQSVEALRLSEEKFSKAIHASPNLVTISTLEEGRLIDANRSFYARTGYSPREAIDRDVSEIGLWTSKAERQQMVEKLKKDGRVRNMELSWQFKSGEIRIMRISAELINIGGVPCVMGISVDVTQQKESQKLLKTVFQNSPFGIFILRNGVITHTNPQFQKTTGYSQEELRGRELLSLVAAEDIDVVNSSIIFTLQKKNPYPCEYRLICKTGQSKWIMQTISQIHLRGDAILGNIIDISELKYLERKVVEYEELSKIKSDLLAAVSHELRTPLATIKGYATMILDYYDRLDADETRDYIRAIDSSTDRLSRLVDNLLDTSRLEAGLVRLQKYATSIAPLIHKTAEDAMIRNTGHTINVNLDKFLPKVNIDSKRICQVLDNLIDNAVKYSPLGTEIIISAKRYGKDLLVQVADQGPGIAPEELEHVFERMYRIEKRFNSSANGVGLGLYICQRLVEAHGGMIWAESTPGQGSTIKFTLPVVTKAKAAGRPATNIKRKRPFSSKLHARCK